MQPLRAPGLNRKKRLADTDLPDSNRSSKSGASQRRISASSKMSEQDGTEAEFKRRDARTSAESADGAAKSGGTSDPRKSSSSDEKEVLADSLVKLDELAMR